MEIFAKALLCDAACTDLSHDSPALQCFHLHEMVLCIPG